MTTSNIPLYFNWSFWAVIVAAVAIFLSQVPPVYLWFRGAKLDVEPYYRIHISHKVGNPNVQMHLILSNTGGRMLRIKSLAIRIERDGQEVADLPAQTYLSEPSDQNAVLLTRFQLKPNEDWVHIVNFLKFFSREEERRYRAAELEMKEDVAKKKSKDEDFGTLIEVENELVEPFVAMFEEKFRWQPGEYSMRLSVTTLDGKADFIKKYRFTLFEADSASLGNIKDDYKYGDGIFWDSGKHPGVAVQIWEA